MPGGPAPLGFAYFVGLKLIGYTAAAYALRRAYPSAAAGVFKVGATRTGIGVAAGAAYGAIWIWGIPHIWSGMGENAEMASASYFLPLIVVRMAEWFLLLRLFFDRDMTGPARLWGFAAAGTVWSYLLDAVGIGAALVIPGGFWVC
jgi:hypothetical protein